MKCGTDICSAERGKKNPRIIHKKKLTTAAQQEKKIRYGRKHNVQAKTKMQQSQVAGKKSLKTFIYCKLYNCIQFDCIMNAAQATGLLSK